MLKRILIVFSLVFLVSCSCGTPEEETNQQRYERMAKGKQEVESNSKKIGDHWINHDKFIYNMDGVIFKKVGPVDWQYYYFFIKLDNNKLVKWKTTEIKFHSKDIGDKVHFEFLRKDRFSDKAIN